MKDIDKFFRKQLKQGTAQPKAENWDKLADMLDQKAPKSFTYWKVAAVALVVMGIVLPLFLYDTPEQSIQLANDSQSIEVEKNTDVLIAEIDEVPIAIPKDAIPKKKDVKVLRSMIVPIDNQIAVVKQETAKEERSEQVEVTNLDPEALLVVINEEPIRIEPSDELQEINRRKVIKITYKRGSATSDTQLVAKTESDTTQRRSIKEFIAQGKEVNPAALLASIRDAKDDLLHRKFNNKDVKNSNK